MQVISDFLINRLDLVFFAYALSFSAVGLLLFLLPKRATSFSIADSLWLLGVFGLLHGANEFLDMWEILRGPAAGAFPWIKLSALASSYLFLLEFGRRALLSLYSENPSSRPVPDWLLGPLLLPALAATAAAAAALSRDLAGHAPLMARLFLGFPGGLLAALAFLGYARHRSEALLRLKARWCFLLVGCAFLAYAVLGGLVLPADGFFPASVLNYRSFISLFGLPVQVLRTLCAILILVGIIGALRIFREGALQEAQQELLDIIEFFPDATFVIDKQRRVIAWNRALEIMTGVPKTDILGKGDFAYSIPFYGSRRPILIDTIAGAHPESEKLYDYVSKRPDGAVYAEVFVPSLYGGKGAHVWVTASPLMDKDGQVYGAIESVRDITDRKLAEEALHRSEAQYRALIETTNTGFLIIDTEGRVLDANQEYVRLTGRRSLDEIRGRPVLEWTAPYEAEKNRQAVERCARDGHIRNFEIDYISPSGEVTPLELNATVVDIGGEARILTLCRDITDRRRAEKLLKESEGKFRTLTEKSLVGVYLVQDGLFRYVNPKLAEIFGYGLNELVDKKGPRDLVQPEDWPLVNENLRRRLEGEISDINYAFRGLKKDGAAIMVEVFGAKSEFGGRPAVLGTLLDITARKAAEAELKNAHDQLVEVNAQLEKRVAERTAQLAELNKELEAFSYSAAHDLKAPLRRVNIFADMLETEAGPDLKEGAKGHLATIKKAVGHMTALVEGLLTLSTTGRRPLDLEEVPLNDLLKEAAAEIRAENPERGIEWTLGELPVVNCDRSMLRQVIANLLGNAVKYSRGSKPARIAVACELKGGDYVFCVRDNGVGFSMEYADKLFGVFQRLHRSEEFEGTGIGLSTVKRIITRHGGRVWAEGEPGKGAVFYFTLPAGRA